MTLEGFEPAIPGSKQVQTHASEGTAAGIIIIVHSVLIIHVAPRLWLPDCGSRIVAPRLWLPYSGSQIVARSRRNM